MAKAKAFYKKDYGSHIGATILLITSFIGLVFMTCGTPLGVLMVPGDLPKGEPRGCNTLWGYRPNCWNAAYQWRVEQDTCPDRRTRWETAEAFSVVALFSLLFNIGAAWMIISGSDMKLTTMFIAVFSIATTTVPWAIVTSLYYTHYCGEWTFTHRERNLGAGYILMVVSFAIQCVGFILFVFIEPEHPVAKSTSSDDSSSKETSKKAASSSASSSK